MRWRTARRCGRGDRVVASRDPHPASRMIKRAMSAGHGRDRSVGRGPARRDQRRQPLRAGQQRGAAAASTSRSRIAIPSGSRSSSSRATAMLATESDAQGASRSTSTARSCAARCSTQLGELAFPPRVTESYVEAAACASVDVERIRAARFRGSRSTTATPAPAGLDAGAAARAAGRVVLDALAASTPTSRRSAAADLPGVHQRRPRKLVEAMGADLGVVLDRAAERIVADRRAGARRFPPTWRCTWS